MRRLFLLLLLLALPLTGHAADIDGHWGLSAPLFSSRGDAPYSLLYRFTNAWTGALDVTVNIHENLDDQGDPSRPLLPSDDAIDARVGPRARRYLRPSEDFSPYLDLFANGGYERIKFQQLGGEQTFQMWSALLGGGLGCEYFFPRWHCGVVAHGPVHRRLRGLEENAGINPQAGLGQPCHPGDRWHGAVAHPPRLFLIGPRLTIS